MLRKRQNGERKKPHESIDSGGDLFHFLLRLHIKVEETFTDDTQRKFKHVFVQVTNLAGLPVLRNSSSVLPNDLSISRNALTQKSRLSKAALPHMKRLFACE